MKIKNKFKHSMIFVLPLLAIALLGCKADGENSGSGSETATESVTLKSSIYTVGASSAAVNSLIPAHSLILTDVTSDTAALTEFNFCITQIKLITDSTSDATSDTVKTSLGLVDVSDPYTEKTWGTIDIPAGFMLSELNVEIHQDSEKCFEAAYSLSFNGVQLTKDLEFTFQFNPPVEINSNDVLNLSLNTIAGAFQAASDAGALDDDSIGPFVENLVEEGNED